jgi:hypothetical protein
MMPNVSTPSAALVASAIGCKQRLSAASSTTSCATIMACLESTALCMLKAGAVLLS